MVFFIKLIKIIATYLNRVIPKGNIVIFSSFPSYTDNSYALYKYIIDHRSDIKESYRIYWAEDTIERLPDTIPQKAVFKKRSLAGIWLFFRAKYIISTHGYLDIESGNGQIQINLWHGCGYKKIPSTHKHYTGDYTIATSDLYKRIQAEELAIPIKNVWVTGLPRTDELFENNDVLKEFGIEHDKYKKVIIWLPTYRKAKGDNPKEASKSMYGMWEYTEEQFNDLNRALSESNCIMIIKPHPLDTVGAIKYELSNICFIEADDLLQKGVDLYQLLPETDVLLSDYSSVIIDYLLLDKPVGLVCADLDEYSDQRGFVFDNIMDKFPGPRICDFESLISYIQNMETYNNEYLEKRRNLNVMFNEYCDGDSSRRVCDKVFGKESSVSSYGNGL